MGKQKSKVDVLYDAASQKYNLGTREEFNVKLQDENKRKALYNTIGKEFNLGTYEDFESKIGVKKKEPTQPTSGSTSSDTSLESQKSTEPTKKVQPINDRMQKILAETSKMAYGVSKATKSNSKEGVLLGTQVAEMQPLTKQEQKPIGDIEDKNLTIDRAADVQARSEAEAQSQKEQQEKAESKMYEGTGFDWYDRINSASGSLLRGVLFNGAAHMSKAIGITAKSLDDKLINWGVSTDASKPITDYFTYNLGSKIEDTGKALFPEYKEYYDRLPEQVIESVGEMAAPIVAAIITRNPGVAIESLTVPVLKEAVKNTAIRSEIASIAATKLAQNTPVILASGVGSGVINYEQAKQEGATEDQATDMFYRTMLGTGLLEQIPLSGLMSRVDKATGGALKNTLVNNVKDIGVAGVKGFLEEGITGTLDQVWQNYSAQEVYDSSKEILEGIAAAGATEGAVGFILNSMGVSLKKAQLRLSKQGSGDVSKLDEIVKGMEDVASESIAQNVELPKNIQSKVDKMQSVIDDPETSLEVKQIAQQIIDEAKAPIINEKKEQIYMYGNISEYGAVRLIEIENEKSRLTKERESISDADIRSKIDEKIDELNKEVAEGIIPFSIRKAEPEITSLPETIDGFLNKRNSDSLASIESRMNNAELINEKEIESAVGPLYNAIDGIEKNESLSDSDKEAAISLIEDKIKKLESYEFETETKIIQPEQKRPIITSKQIVGTVARGSRKEGEVTKERFIGKEVDVDGSDGVIEYNETSDVLSVATEAGRKDIDFNYVEYSETIQDENGVVQGVTLVDNRDGSEITIKDQDLAYDIAIKAKAEQIGEIQDSIFDIAYEEVTTPAKTKEVIKPKPLSQVFSSGSQPSQVPASSQPSLVSPNIDEWENSKQMMKKQEEALVEMGKKRPFFQRFIKNWFERQQGIIKALGKGAQADKVRSMMTAVAGARSYADDQFQRKEKEIFGKKNIEQEKVLDLLLFHRRVIQIDSNYDSRQEKRINHPEGYNKERSEATIQKLKEEIGEKAYEKLSKDADNYFKAPNEILGRMYEEGLISEAVYDELKNDDYIQRIFIDHINDTADGRAKSLEDYGLKASQIKALEEGSTGLLLLDSRSLLNASYRSLEQRVFQNNANKALAEFVASNTNNKLGKEMKPKYKKDGTKEYGAADKGYTKINYFKNGEIFAIQLKNEYAAEWLDLEKTTTNLDNRLRKLMGTALLKKMATGINATFAVVNIPADYFNVIMFTDTFDNTNVYNAMAKLAFNFTKNFGELVALNSVGLGRGKFKELSDSFIKYGGNMEFLTNYGKPDELITRDKGVIKKAAGKLGNFAVNTLAFAGEQSERAMRLSVFDEVRNQMLSKEGGKSKVSPEKWDEINYIAAAKARETMDFAKGGLLAKKVDVISPYFNAGAQGTRVAAQYIYNNPKKFASKWAQISAPVASLMLYNAMVGDEEDWENIPEYEKNNYFIIFNSFKKEGENRGYFRIKKTPALAPFLALVESGTMAAYNQFTGKKWGATESVAQREWDTINDALPIPLDPRNLPNKLPPIPRSVLSYFANYDFYRKQKLVTGQEEDILEQYQGVSDEKIPDFYKKAGQVSADITGGEGLSPRKLQKTTEMIITSPNTNPIIGGAYLFLDKLVNTFSDVPESWNSKEKQISDIFGGAKARVYREVNPDYKKYQDESLKTLQKELNSSKYLIRNEISSKVENGASENEVRKLIESKEISNDEKQTLDKYAESLRETKELSREIPEYYKLAPIKYWRGSPEDKAKLFAHNMGLIDPESEEFGDIMKDMKRMKISTSSRFMGEYYKIYTEATQSKSK